MHILLTDVLTCPRCGPAFGLILLANHAENRRILDGSLGCANCRERYPVRDGAVHFVAGGGPLVHTDNAEDAMRLAALMGVTRGPGYVLLGGPAASLAGAVSRLLEDVEVVALVPPADGNVAGVAAADAAAETSGAAAVGSQASVNVLVTGRAVPLATARMAGVALSGSASDSLLEEGARVLSPLGRMVLLDAPGDAAERLAAAGLRTVAAEGSTVVAARR